MAAHDRLICYIEMTDVAIRFPPPDVEHCLTVLRRARRLTLEELAVEHRHLDRLEALRAEIVGG